MDDLTPTPDEHQLQMAKLELDFIKVEEILPVRPGGICPKCKQGIIDYDGMLVLRCPMCGYAESGCFT